METKLWWTSTTIQGLIIEAAMLVITLFKINILKDEIQALLTGAFGIIGVIMVIIGRQKATQPLGWSRK